MLGFGEQTACVFQGFQRFQTQRVFLKVDVEVFQRTQTIVLHAFEALHGRQMRFQALGFNE